MNKQNWLKTLFTYKPEENYEFSISEANVNNDSLPKEQNQKTLFSNILDNIKYIKTKYNTLINSDIILREFILNARGKQYKALLLYIDGMVDSKIINDFVLEPLMLKNRSNTYEGEQKKVISELKTNNVTVRKVKKFDLIDYIYNSLLPQNSVNKVDSFNDLFAGINSGNCALFVDTIAMGFDIDVKGFKQRSVDSPNNEIVIKGPHEAFVENIRTNTSLLRRIINNENLIIENIEIGEITKTKCAICYISNIANNDLVAEVKYRINNLKVDSILSSGQLEQLIVDFNNIGVPQILSTERPDKVAKHLLEGRVSIIVNGTPYVLIMPAILIDFMSSPEDNNLDVHFANFLRGLRFLAAFITLLLPGLYVALTSFHQEILPTELLFSILASRQNVPFPVIFEILVMEISFELIREAGLRVPSPIGPTIGIVGALVLGQAAVSASIVSPILIIIVAITGISSFAIPDFSFGFHLRYSRFIFILLGFMSGFLGISLGIFVYISLICDLRSFGIPFAVPFAPATNSKGNGYFLPPMWKREYRANYLAPKKQKEQENISMKWKFKKD